MAPEPSAARIVGVLLQLHLAAGLIVPFMLTVGCWIILLNSFLFRFRLVPRWLAGFGVAAALGQVSGVTLRGLWGYAPEARLAMPLAPAYVALAMWLIFKGLDLQPRSADPHEAAGAGERRAGEYPDLRA